MGREAHASARSYRSDPPAGLTLCSRWQREVIDRLQGLAREFEFAATSLVIAWRNQASFIYHDYPQAFAERYYGSEGVINDPVLSACRGQVKPVSWRAYERSPFYAEAQNFGLFDGLTVPVHGPGSLVVAVTVAGRTLIGPREVVELPRVLESLGRETVERVGFKEQRGASPAVVLSQKQALVLHHLAEGMPQADIAKMLGVSLTSVKRLVVRSMNVLGAENQTQAVAIAILEGKLGFRQAP